MVASKGVLALKDLANTAGLVRRVTRRDRFLLDLSALDSSELDTGSDEVNMLDEMLGNVVSTQQSWSVTFGAHCLDDFKANVPVSANSQA